jgi:hypothetical protein
MADTKKLYTRKKRLKEELRDISDEKYALTREETLKHQELSKINKKLDKARKGELIITEHAMLRYMERIKNLSIDELKELVVPIETKALIKRFGNGNFPAGGTHKVIVRNNTVLTIIETK